MSNRTNFTVAVESLIGIFVFKLLEGLRKVLCTLLRPIIPWNIANALLVLLVRKLFGDRIPLRVAVGGLRFNVRWPSLDLEVLKEVIKEKCYCLTSDFEPKKGEVVIDLGAHIGAYTISVAKRGTYVIAVEPASSNLKLLVQNVRLNGVENHVKILKVAVLGFRGNAKFPVESLDLNLGSFSLYRGKKHAWLKYERVLVATLDDIVAIAKINRVDIIKMDIEGAEVDVIKSAFKLIREYRPKLVLEVHGLGNLCKLFSYLRQINYGGIKIMPAKTTMSSEGELYYLYAIPG